MGAGKYARMMRRRQVGPIFRYLHDEISGGVMSLSHLKTKVAYTGFCGRVDGIDYGFNSNKFFDNPLLTGTPGTGVSATLFDQTGLSSLISWGNTYNYDNQDLAYNAMSRGASNIPSSDQAWTFIAVYNPMLSTRTQRNETRVLNNSVGAGIKGLTVWYETDGSIVIRLRDAVAPNIEITYTSAISGDVIYMIAVDYDGLRTTTSFNLYVNNMNTALTPSSIVGATKAVFTESGINYPFFNGNQNGIQGAMFDAHYWDRVIDSTERNTAKTILEQYYTF
jgi:hypothetical protein